MAESRRVQMTRRLIKEALIELMEDHEFSKITISEVCERADINRSTFYSHYRDTRDVLTDAEDDIIARLPKVDNSEENIRDAIKSVLSFIKENSELISIMVVKRKDDSFMQKLLSNVLARYEHLSKIKDEVMTRMAYTFCTSGIMGIIKVWIESDFAISLDSFTDIALSLAVKVTS